MNTEFKIALISHEAKLGQDFKDLIDRNTIRFKREKTNIKVFSTLPTMEELIHYGSNLIIVHMSGDQMEEGLVLLESLSRISDQIPVVICSTDLNTDLMLSCIKKGVRDFLKYPFQENEIAEMVRRLIRETPIVAGTSALATGYTFFSYKGGLGTTFLACNTAVAIAHVTKSRVLLWDMVIQNGDVPFFFDYEPAATLTDLLENASRIDDVYLNGTIPIHPTGVSVLASPKRPEEAEAIRNDQLQGLHQTLRKYYDYIVIDAGHVLTDQIISAMDTSKYIMLVTDLHLPVLRNTLRCLEVFERLGYGPEKFKVLLNRYNSKYQKFDLSKAEEILRYPVTLTIPNDYITVSRSLNTGIPVADLDEHSLLAKQFEHTARLLVSDFKKQDREAVSLTRRFKNIFSKLGKTKPAEPGLLAQPGTKRAGDMHGAE